MLKGLGALFSTRLILNPFVLAGIAHGIYLLNNFTYKDIYLQYKKLPIYIVILIASVLYHTLFIKHYQLGGDKVDVSDTIIAIFGGVFRFFIASVLTINLVMSFAF